MEQVAVADMKILTYLIYRGIRYTHKVKEGNVTKVYYDDPKRIDELINDMSSDKQFNDYENAKHIAIQLIRS